jgi:hypothetical protein
MHRALAFILTVLVAIVFLSRLARAEPPSGKATPVYVLSVWTNDADDQADALTQALRTRVRLAPGWSLAETNQSFETLAIALRCPPTPNQLCLDRIGDQLHADHYIWGTIAKQRVGEVTAELRLWSRGKAQIETSESYSDNLKDASDDALRAVAGRLFSKVTNTRTSGTVVFHAGTATGAALVDSVEKGKLVDGVARLDVSPGTHTLSVSVTGFSAPPQTITLVDGGEQDLNFALSPAPAPAIPESPPEPDHSTKTPFPTRKVLGYSAVIVGVGLLVTAGIEGASWSSDKNASDKDRQTIPNNVTDVCTTTQQSTSEQDACQKSKNAATAAKLGWIFGGVGAVLTGTGIWLVLSGGESTSESSAKAATRSMIDFIPSIGTRASSLDVRVRF